jgi:hypothetical protein
MWTVASSTILLGGASGRSRRSLAEKMAGDIDYRKSSSLFCAGFEICLHEDLDGLLAGINFDADRRITEIYLVSATVAPPDDRMRHFCATPVTELPSRQLRDVVSFPKIQLTAREVKKTRSSDAAARAIEWLAVLQCRTHAATPLRCLVLALIILRIGRCRHQTTNQWTSLLSAPRVA